MRRSRWMYGRLGGRDFGAQGSGLGQRQIIWSRRKATKRINCWHKQTYTQTHTQSYTAGHTYKANEVWRRRRPKCLSCVAALRDYTCRKTRGILEPKTKAKSKLKPTAQVQARRRWKLISWGFCLKIMIYIFYIYYIYIIIFLPFLLVVTATESFGFKLEFRALS